ncbi:hypothetical protein [Streptomyces durhamensis]|uniref:hypothetical protein n=1 Tax=Streptomyces durhamensis TaxID=68194 RepID=UPI0012FEA053|nr:hypothetical protein [Streptomyces durhamensis]
MSETDPVREARKISVFHLADRQTFASPREVDQELRVESAAELGMRRHPQAAAYAARMQAEKSGSAGTL